MIRAIPKVNVGRYVPVMSGVKPKGRHQDKRLTAQGVRALDTPGLHGDGNGLYLKVRANGAKQWIQRIVIRDKRTDLGLGPVSLVTLAEARERALENRKLARAGGDPLAAKKGSMPLQTFEFTARALHEFKKPTYRSVKHSNQWITTLETYVFPYFGSKPIDAVGSADLLSALKPIWNEKAETARRVKQRIGEVMRSAVAHGLRSTNPADSISQGLHKHDRSSVNHRLALPYDAVGAAIATVRASDAGKVTKLAFEFLVLTATRSGETREATWSEFDLVKAVWTIPAARMKAKKLHRVPLPPRCLAILEEAATLKRNGDDLVFPGTKDKRPLSDMTLSKLMRELGIAAVPHGFRSSFRDWTGEATNHPREVVEFALAHVIQDKAEAAYARSDLFEKRRLLMDDWSDYLKASY